MVRNFEKRGIVDAEHRIIACYLCRSDLRRLVGAHAGQMGPLAQSSEESASCCLARPRRRRLRFTDRPVLLGVYPIGSGTRTITVGREMITKL